MKTKSRKQELINRAVRYTKQWNRGEDGKAIAAASYLDGYKAAMRDLRKMVRECYADAAVHTDPEKRIKMRNHCVRVRLERFLRPLR